MTVVNTSGSVVGRPLGRANNLLQSKDSESYWLQPGFNFSVEFRWNFGVFFVFASYREEKFRYFSFSNLKIQKYL